MSSPARILLVKDVHALPAAIVIIVLECAQDSKYVILPTYIILCCCVSTNISDFNISLSGLTLLIHGLHPHNHP